MFPLVSTFWLGSVMKLPGLTPASIGIYKPPAAASKIETATLSPMPNVISAREGENAQHCYARKTPLPTRNATPTA